jgi:hypothetical protein
MEAVEATKAGIDGYIIDVKPGTISVKGNCIWKHFSDRIFLLPAILSRQQKGFFFKLDS